jgi:hypothetical protein
MVCNRFESRPRSLVVDDCGVASFAHGAFGTWCAGLLLSANAGFIAWMVLLSAQALAPGAFAAMRRGCCGTVGKPAGPCGCCGNGGKGDAADVEAGAAARCARCCGSCWCGDGSEYNDEARSGSGNLYGAGDHANDYDPDLLATPYRSLRGSAKPRRPSD